MDPTTSFVMALVAVIVSGCSAIASFWAIGQTSRYHPAPFLASSIEDSNDNPLVLRFTVVNMGRSSAHDVKLYARRRQPEPSGFEPVWNTIDLPVSTPITVDMSTVAAQRLEMGAEHYIVPEGDPRQTELEFELRWRQWPAMRRIRHVRWRVTIDADGFPTLRPRRERGALTTAFVETWQGIRDAFSQAGAALRELF